MHQRFGDAKVRGRADGNEFRQAFNYAKNRGEQVIVQATSSGGLHASLESFSVK
jgi:hypothetical protein